MTSTPEIPMTVSSREVIISEFADLRRDLRRNGGHILNSAPITVYRGRDALAGYAVTYEAPAEEYSPAGWWAGFAGPYATRREAVHFALISHLGTDAVYECNADGEIVR